MPVLIDRGSPAAKVRFLFSHGAGAPMTSPFMELMTDLLVERGLAVTRFEFAYMAARRDGGKRRPPPKAELLVAEYMSAVDAVAARARGERLVIGGKSMGGRVASLAAGELFGAGRIAGLCLGYPFHPPAKPEALRTAHLAALECPALIVQGERDPFGSREEVAGMDLSSAIAIVWIRDGDHDFGPRGASGATRKGNLALAADAIGSWATQLR